MNVEKKACTSPAFRFAMVDNGKEIAHGYMYVIENDFHAEPYALFEYFAVEEAYRGKGIGTKFVTEMVEAAKELGCYKILMQSRYGREGVHAFYEKLGFHDHGKNYRMNFFTTEAKVGAHGATCDGCET